MEDQISLSKDKINIVVAYTSKNRFISYKNDLPWKRSLRGDNKFLRSIIYPCDGSKVLLIMGRVTFENIPPFKDIQIAVVTKSENVLVGGLPFKSFEKALEFGKQNNYVIVIFGGEGIYKEAIEHDHRIFCTIVEEKDFQGDRRFPPCETPLKNVSHEVAKYLLVKGATKTWELKEDENGQKFVEGGFTYRFYRGES